jgi:hypothetical protein
MDDDNDDDLDFFNDFKNFDDAAYDLEKIASPLELGDSGSFGMQTASSIIGERLPPFTLHFARFYALTVFSYPSHRVCTNDVYYFCLQ